MSEMSRRKNRMTEIRNQLAELWVQGGMDSSDKGVQLGMDSPDIGYKYGWSQLISGYQ